jgi:membrane protease YdiL (CAAX protease family)
MNTKLIAVGVLTFIASLAPDIVVRESMGYLPSWWFLAKIVLLLIGTLHLLYIVKDKNSALFGFLLIVITAVQMFVGLVAATDSWQSVFPQGTFGRQFGGAILLKLLGIIPILGVLLLLYRSPREVFLQWGDLSTKASRIGWLGIEEGKIGWGRLTIISALLISAGTLLLTLLTVTGFSMPSTFDRLPPLLPLIILFALANSFSEGVVYRNSVLGPLKETLPKGMLVIIAAAYFGVAHYYGAPGGVFGAVMSGLLGWYMCRSMYETRGFLTAWIIHFFQDVVIFSTVVILWGN